VTQDGLAHTARASGIRLVAGRYSRVSKDKRGDQRSVEEQDVDNLGVCEAEGWDPGEPYCDNDLSASRFSRKKRDDWDRLIEDLAERRFHVVILWESSRGDRRLAHWITFLDLCRDIGVLIHITSHERTYDVRKRRDYKTLAEEGLDSADASELTSERVQRGSKSRARKGRPHGRDLYGYERVYGLDEKGRRDLVDVVPDERPRTTSSLKGEPVSYTHAGVVREIIERLASGDALRNVAVHLNGRGIPSPRNGAKGWTSTRVREIATNASYAGKRVYKGEVLEGVDPVWPPLVDVVTFQAAGSRFAPPGSVRRNEGSVKRLLAGLAVCGVCGRKVRRMGRKEAPRYVCAPDNIPGVGYCVSRDIAQVDAYVERTMWLRLAKADLAELFAADRRANEQLARLEAEIVEKEKRLEEARRSYMAGRLPLASLEAMEAEEGPQIVRARERMSESRVAPVIRDLVGLSVGEIAEAWKARSVPQRREIIRVLAERIEILQVGSRKRYLPEESVRIVWRGSAESRHGAESGPEAEAAS
jgi:DNA invertase Pin-like site-specific DNA recombinase